MQRLTFLAVCSAALVVTAAANAQPTLSFASPSAIAPQQTTQITINGAKLDDPLNVWTSFPAQIEIVPPADGKPVNTRIVCKITPAPGATAGIGGVIVGTSAGVSNTLLMAIDDLPTIAENGQNATRESAQPLTLPIAVDGATQAGTSDFYQFSAKAGQRVSVEVLARRMGSPLDPVIWLRDAAGGELFYADDDPSLGVDCRFQRTIATDGDYVIEIRDNAYQAGRRYRLRVGDFPLAATAYPLGGQIGQTEKFEFTGPGAAAAAPLELSIPSDLGDRFGIAAKYPGGNCSALVSAVASELPNVLELEPDQESEKNATPIVLPCAVNGRLLEAGDRDYFQFEAKQGQRYTFRAVSRSLGSPTYAFLRLLNASGGKLAETGVSDAEEESLKYTFPADGTYVLMVEDLLRRGGPEHAYRVEIAPTAPFSLSLKADNTGRYQFIASKNGAFAVDLVCARDGYDGPITLSATANGQPLNVYSNVIAEKQNVAKLIIAAPPDSKDGDLGIVHITGQANVNGSEIASLAGTAALLRTKIPQLAFAPAWHDGLIAVVTAPDVPAIYTATPNRDAVYLARGVGQAALTIALERTNKEFKDPLIVAVDGLPTDFSYAVKRNGDGEKETYDVTLSAPKDLPEGQHAIRVVSYGELKGRGQKTETPEIPIHVVTPLTVAVTPPEAIVAGQKQKVKVAVARFTDGKGDDNQPVAIKFTSLPPGVTAAGEAQIAADQNEIEIELTAAADAQAVKFEQLTAQAVTKFHGADVTVDSNPATIEVKSP